MMTPQFPRGEECSREVLGLEPRIWSAHHMLGLAPHRYRVWGGVIKKPWQQKTIWIGKSVTIFDSSGNWLKMTVIVGQAQISIYDNQHLLWGQSKSFYNCTWLHFTSSVRLTDTGGTLSGLTVIILTWSKSPAGPHRAGLLIQFGHCVAGENWNLKNDKQ